jgi:predicted metal-dependent HD superfamily phosphohydrolase
LLLEIEMDVNISQLQARWEALLRPLTTDKKLIKALFADLVERYSEDGRTYHNLRHIQNVLNSVDDLKELVEDETAVQLAAWFHDVIYEMQPSSDKSTNEERSANYAAQVLEPISLPEATMALIRQLIQATQLGHPAPNGPNFHVLLDADLATLAADYDEYNEYAQAIRQEFAFVPEEQYRIGRRQVLTSFLERERIFLTETMYQHHEQASRNNIQREIDRLS